MELGPIPGIRELPAVRPRQGELRQPTIFEIDASAKPGEDGGQRNGRKAAGAEENDDELRLEDGPAAQTPEENHPGRIDTFA